MVSGTEGKICLTSKVNQKKYRRACTILTTFRTLQSNPYRTHACDVIEKLGCMCGRHRMMIRKIVFILWFWQKKISASDLYFLPDSFPATMLSQPIGSDSDSDVEDHVPLKRALKARIDSDSDWYNRWHLVGADFTRSNLGVEIDISCTYGNSSFSCMQIIIFTMVIMECQLTWVFYKLE